MAILKTACASKFVLISFVFRYFAGEYRYVNWAKRVQNENSVTPERKQIFFQHINNLNISRGQLKRKAAERVPSTIRKKMNELYVTLHNSERAAADEKKQDPKSERRASFVLCFSCPLPLAAPSCIFTAQSHPSDTERLVSRVSGERISLWDPTAKRALVRALGHCRRAEGAHSWSLGRHGRGCRLGLAVFRLSAGKAKSENVTGFW